MIFPGPIVVISKCRARSMSWAWLSVPSNKLKLNYYTVGKMDQLMKKITYSVMIHKYHPTHYWNITANSIVSFTLLKSRFQRSTNSQTLNHSGQIQILKLQTYIKGLNFVWNNHRNHWLQCVWSLVMCVQGGN